MRLIEFLKFPDPKPANPIWYSRIPLHYLGGSYNDYRNYVSSRLFESVMLNEAAIDRYKQMINVFAELDKVGDSIGIGETSYDTAFSKLQWAMRVLKRDDRIVWYMRLVKGTIFSKLQSMRPASDPERPETQQYMDFFTKEYRKANGKLMKLYGNEAVVNHAIHFIDSSQWHTIIEHLMSMGLDGIDTTVWKNQFPDVLLQHFRRIENEWKERANSVIDMSDDEDADKVETIIKFPDGSAWFNLNRTSCEIEGDAMGHCGNTATNGPTESVLSYREQVDKFGRKIKAGKNDNGVYWRPRLTFIYDNNTGMIGEMKGRANTKPKDDLHPYIVALLRTDMVKGIIGGGYAPQENFSMDDLSDELKTQLIKDKPELGTIYDQYNFEGLTKGLVNRIESTLEHYDIPNKGINYERKVIIIDNYKNYGQLLDIYSQNNSVASNIWNIMVGNDDFLFHGDYYTGGFSERDDLFTEWVNKNPDELKNLKEYVISEYGDNFGMKLSDEGEIVKADNYDDVEYDIDDTSDILRVLDENDDEIYDQIGWAIADGNRSGAETEMYDAFWDWVKEPFDAPSISVHLTGKDGWADPVEMVFDLQEFIYNTREVDYLEELGYHGWDDMLEITDIQEPYYGWDGYNDAAALDSLEGNIEIPEIDIRVVEIKGNGKSSDIGKIKKMIKNDFPGQSHSDKLLYAENGDLRVSSIELIRGVITLTAFALNENKKALMGQFARKLASYSNELGVPVIIRRYNSSSISNLVGEAGFKKINKGYYRHDPPVNEGVNSRRRNTTKSFDLFEMTVDQAESVFARFGKSPSKVSYRELVRKFQTGLSNQDSEAQEALKMINSAWDVLKDKSQSSATHGSSHHKDQNRSRGGKQDYTNIEYIKSHLHELALETGDSISKWTIWGFDGHFFRGTVTVRGNPKIFKDMAEAMFVWQTQGGNSYPCRAVFVSHAREPNKIYLIYADGTVYDNPIPFEHESFNMNPSNDRHFSDSLPDILDGLLN